MAFEIGPAEIEQRILAVMRRGMRLGCVAWVRPGPNGESLLAAFDGKPATETFAIGETIQDLGAASPVLSTGRPLLLNPDRERPIRVPYCRKPVVIRGAMAVPLAGGVAWADRADDLIQTDEFQVFQELCAVLEEDTGFHRTASAHTERADFLSWVLEGLHSILTCGTDEECVAALVESTAQMTRSRIGVVVLVADSRAEATVVAAYGEDARHLVGRNLSPTEGLVGLAMRSGTAVPSTHRFASTMGGVLGPDLPPIARDGDSVVVQPIGQRDSLVGALGLVGGDYDRPAALYGLRSLSDASALLVQRMRLQVRIAQDAMMDGLTGLYNRKAFLRHLNEVFAFCRRHGHDLSLLMVDADHFKQVNDRHGHLAGDRALCFISDIIRRSLRESDVPGRYGGEEFVIALPQTTLSGALRVAERIREQCAASPILLGTERVRLTVSIGAAWIGQALDGPEALIAAADQAMYAAKHAGRNRVMAAAGRPAP